MTTWKQMLDEVKEECLVGLWSKGVNLARTESVRGERHSGGEWTFRVRLSEDEIAPTVVLSPEHGDWECDCEGPAEPCEHVAACIITAAQGDDILTRLFEGEQRAGQLRHEIVRTPSGIRVDRSILAPGHPPLAISGSLLDLPTSETERRNFEPTQEDLAVDLLLKRGGPIPFEKAARLLEALVGVTELELDQRVVRASGAPLLPKAKLVDAKREAVELIIEADPSVDEVVAPGVLRAGDRLHPFGAGARFGKRLEQLPFRKTFPPSEFGDLAGRILPELERYLSISIETRRLPQRQGQLAPWLEFELDTVEEGLQVLARLVYGEPPVARVENGTLVHLRDAIPQRNPSVEKALELRLRQELNLRLDRRVMIDPQEAARFLSALNTFADGRERPSGADAGRERPELTPRLRADDQETGEGLDLVFETTANRGEPGQAVEAEAVVAAWKQGLDFVPLSGGGFAHLPHGWLDRHGHLVADLLAARRENEGQTPRCALPILGDLCEILESPPSFDRRRLQNLLESTEPEERPPPAGFRGTLRGYQAQGVAWLLRLREANLGAILADDMGLGKTVQALCAIRGPSLIVCPRSVIHNWTRELERFRPDLSVSLYHGPRRALDDADITLTTFATLRNDIEALSEPSWDTVVLDEAQAIKNASSQVARAAYALQASFRVSLSGTPVENRLEELWSQMHFVNRGLLGGRRDFVERYEKPILAGDAATTQRLQSRLRPFLLRRRKSEVARDLPPRTESVLYCELEENERAIYDSVRLSLRADVVKKLAAGGSVLAALEALLRLRQAACHPGLLPGREASSSSKVEALSDALEDVVADGHKALVFSQWTSMLDRVQPHLNERQIDHLRLDGSTRDRGAIVDRFQDTSGPPVLLISLTAGGTGLNLTAADHVFLLDPWWNPAVEAQAADRAHRIGQDRPVMVYRLVSKDTVEEKILDLQEQKRRLAESALGGASTKGEKLSREELLALLD